MPVNVDGATLDVIVIFMLGILIISVLGVLAVLLKRGSAKKDTEKDALNMSDTLRNSLEEFGRSIEKSIRDSMDEFANKITGSGMQVNLSSQVLDDTVDKFDQSIKGLAEIVNNINKYNNKLSNDIEKIEASYGNLTEVLTATSQTVADNYASVGNFAKDIKHAAFEITTHNSQVVNELSNMTTETKASVSSIKELAELLKNDMNSRIKESKEYQENINQLMEKISGDISILTHNTTTSFSKSMEESSKFISEKVAEDFNKMVSEFEGTFSSIKDLSEVLKSDLGMRTIEAKEYQENISQLIEKVSGDISIIGHNTVTSFSKSMEESANAISGMVLQDFGKMMSEFEGAFSSIKEFSEVLRSELDLRSTESKEYQANIAKLMEKMDEEISTLGEKTISAFSQSLDESVKITYQRAAQDFNEMASGVEASVSSIKELTDILKSELSARAQEAKVYQENIDRLMLKLSGDMSVLTKDTTEAFSQGLEESGKAISEKVTQNMDEVFKGILAMLDELKENEKLLAKTIVMLPDQVITYNETASNKIGMQLDEIKRLFRGNGGY